MCVNGPEIAAGENDAATALEEAIEACDAQEVRRAIKQGAPLAALPDSSVAPLLAALYRCDCPGWQECAETLLECGCSIDGDAQSDPPILECVGHFVPEPLSLQLVEFLLAHGADVNATDPVCNSTALFESVMLRRCELVQFLLQHGADVHVKNKQEVSAIDWLRERLDDESPGRCRSEFAELLSLLTGETILDGKSSEG